MIGGELPRGARLRFLERGGEAERLSRRAAFAGEELGAGGPCLEGLCGALYRQYLPVRSRSQRGWWKRAQRRVTVPFVIDWNVPGSAAVER